MAKVLGIFEKVGFPEYGMDAVTAKIDTGAFTGALHCTNIHEKEVDGIKVLHFSPFDKPDLVVKVDNFMIRHVTSSNGKQEDRYFIETVVTIQDQDYPIILSLADRSEMRWPVLIGRRFLRTNNLLVDVRKMNK